MVLCTCVIKVRKSRIVLCSENNSLHDIVGLSLCMATLWAMYLHGVDIIP